MVQRTPTQRSFRLRRQDREHHEDESRHESINAPIHKAASTTTNYNTGRDNIGRNSRLDQANETTWSLFSRAADYVGIRPCAMLCVNESGTVWTMTDKHPHLRQLPGYDADTEALVRKVFTCVEPEPGTALRTYGYPENDELQNSMAKRKSGFSRATTPSVIDISSDEGSSEAGCSIKRRRKIGLVKQNEGYDGSELGTFSHVNTQQVVMRSFRVDQLDKIQYHEAICNASQLALKDILTAWIKACHPQKQSQHPYNGGRTRLRSLNEYGYEGHYTMPSYWPSDARWDAADGDVHGCRHKEPYHLHKLERYILFSHLLRFGAPFTLEKLRESTSNLDRKSPKEFPPATMKQLEIIYGIREHELRYENGAIDGDAVIHVALAGKKTNSKTSAKDATVSDLQSRRSIESSPSCESDSTEVLEDSLDDGTTKEESTIEEQIAQEELPEFNNTHETDLTATSALGLQPVLQDVGAPPFERPFPNERGPSSFLYDTSGPSATPQPNNFPPTQQGASINQPGPFNYRTHASCQPQTPRSLVGDGPYSSRPPAFNPPHDAPSNPPRPVMQSAAVPTPFAGSSSGFAGMESCIPAWAGGASLYAPTNDAHYPAYDLDCYSGTDLPSSATCSFSTDFSGGSYNDAVDHIHLQSHPDVAQAQQQHHDHEYQHSQHYPTMLSSTFQGSVFDAFPHYA